MKKYIDGELVDCSAEETTQIENEQQTNKQIHLQEREDAETKENNKTSGKAKLKSGDALTDDEIEALFG